MTAAKPSPTAAVLIIGNEILSGRTQDSNLNVIAKKLFSCGIVLAEARVVPDIAAEIVAAVNALRARYTYVFTTGGIGPTHDDITAASLATAFGLKLIEHPEARARLEAYYGDKINPARLRMALTPEGATLIENTVSAAPGFRIGNVFVMAGVPDIMRAMLDSVADGLTQGPKIHSATIVCALAESHIADDLTALAGNYPQLDIGSYPSFRAGKIGLALVVRGTDADGVKAATTALAALIAAHGGVPVVEGQS